MLAFDLSGRLHGPHFNDWDLQVALHCLKLVEHVADCDPCMEVDLALSLSRSEVILLDKQPVH